VLIIEIEPNINFIKKNSIAFRIEMFEKMFRRYVSIVVVHRIDLAGDCHWGQQRALKAAPTFVSQVNTKSGKF